jgi:hypothetical protein
MVFSGPEGRPGEQLRMNTPPMNFGGKNKNSKSLAVPSVSNLPSINQFPNIK